MVCVYCIRNRRTGKRYIGQTQSLMDRMKLHIKELEQGHHRCKALQDDFNNRDKFDISVLCNCSTKDEMDFMEQYYINLYDTINNGYNQLAPVNKNRYAKLYKIFYNKINPIDVA